VLGEIDAIDVPELLAFNKADVALAAACRLGMAHPGSVVLSARSGAGVPELLRVVADRLRAFDKTVELRIPVARGDVLAALHREGEVLDERYEGETAELWARLDQAGTRRFAEFVV
jgi:GTP-binding protein HflX